MDLERIDYKSIVYRLNVTTGKYEKEPTKLKFNKLPHELWIEETRELKIKCNGAPEIITGRILNKRRKFFSGLRALGVSNWFYGNDFEFRNGIKKKSLCLFQFGKNQTLLTVYYFNNWYPDKVNVMKLESYILRFICSKKESH